MKKLMLMSVLFVSGAAQASQNNDLVIPVARLTGNALVRVGAITAVSTINQTVMNNNGASIADKIAVGLAGSFLCDATCEALKERGASRDVVVNKLSIAAAIIVGHKLCRYYYPANLTQAQANLTQAHANFLQAQANLDLAQASVAPVNNAANA